MVIFMFLVGLMVKFIGLYICAVETQPFSEYHQISKHLCTIRSFLHPFSSEYCCNSYIKWFNIGAHKN